MKTIIPLLTLSLLGATLAHGTQLTIACGAVGTERQYCQESVDRWSAQSGHSVRVIHTPDSSNERLTMYQMLLSERHDTVDVFQIDVVWPALLDRFLLDLSLYIPPSEISEHFTSLIDNNTVEGKLVAMPWYVDTGLLYYRADLLKKHNKAVPRTWQQLERVALDIQQLEQNEQLTGFVWQGEAYEGLTCNVTEWLGSAGLKSIVGDDQQLLLSSPAAIDMLNTVQRWIGTISPAEVLSMREEDVRTVFEQGNAIFMRNWPYAWNLSQYGEQSAVKGNVGVTTLPGVSEAYNGSGTLGGWQLAATRYTKHPELAADLIRFMTSESEQRQRLLLGYFPTRASLFEGNFEPEISPLLDAVGASLPNATARPSTQFGKHYKTVSRLLYEQTNQHLRQNRNPAEQLLTAIETAIERNTLGNFSAR